MELILMNGLFGIEPNKTCREQMPPIRLSGISFVPMEETAARGQKLMSRRTGSWKVLKPTIMGTTGKIKILNSAKSTVYINMNLKFPRVGKQKIHHRNIAPAERNIPILNN